MISNKTPKTYTLLLKFWQRRDNFDLQPWLNPGLKRSGPFGAWLPAGVQPSERTWPSFDKSDTGICSNATECAILGATVRCITQVDPREEQTSKNKSATIEDLGKPFGNSVLPRLFCHVPSVSHACCSHPNRAGLMSQPYSHGATSHTKVLDMTLVSVSMKAMP